MIAGGRRNNSSWTASWKKGGEEADDPKVEKDDMTGCYKKNELGWPILKQFVFVVVSLISLDLQ